MSPSSIATRIASLHPAVLTAPYLAWAFIGFVPPSAWPLCMVLSVAWTCAWSWAVFTVSAARRSAPVAAGRRWVFLAAPLLLLLASVAGWSMNNSPPAFIVFATLLAAFWQTAQALESADAPEDRVPTGRVLTTMFLLVSPVGPWALRQRIRRAALAA